MTNDNIAVKTIDIKKDEYGIKSRFQAVYINQIAIGSRTISSGAEREGKTHFRKAPSNNNKKK
ncbi:hypothetical protein IIF7_16907 [Zunongwangia atlantica 22II14-10F7]|uniref:Uncharacterized protein n=1 Tax=Zunongwangia atlantica 22II14-10F7 TaxID=1185767 RepID=A0A1Y1SZL4_9FLAO|nr:hypothetical protein IIF7_16907 [Zunongwangia atlantica 22II14-10F7]